MKRKERPDTLLLTDASGNAVINLSQSFNTKKYRLIEMSEDVLATVSWQIAQQYLIEVCDSLNS